MIPYKHQIELSNLGLKLILKYNLVYLAMEQRTGKIITSLLIAEQLNVKNILILTTKNAKCGWEHALLDCDWLAKDYTLTNYQRIKYELGKKCDLIILDESHRFISGFPKTSKTWALVRQISYDIPLIYLSATPYSQGIQLLYHQLALSKYSPWRHYYASKYGAYQWYKQYALTDNLGNTKKYYLYGKSIETYKDVDTKKAYADVKHLFIHKTRSEIGFEHEPADILHYIDLENNIKKIYNKLLQDKVLNFTKDKISYTLIANTGMKLLCALHMLESGVLKLEEDYLVLDHNEKIDFIKKEFGDTIDMAIMYNYIAEGTKLRKQFNNACILQGAANAEGIDLMHIKTLIIYSQNFNTAQYIQRRARQANIKRTIPIKVHYLLVKKAISDQVYKTVAKNKKNFVDALFEANQLT